EPAEARPGLSQRQCYVVSGARLRHGPGDVDWCMMRFAPIDTTAPTASSRSDRREGMGGQQTHIHPAFARVGCRPWAHQGGSTSVGSARYEITNEWCVQQRAAILDLCRPGRPGSKSVTDDTGSMPSG